jgi:hypothetical protein
LRRLFISFVCVTLVLLAVPCFAFTIDLYETANNKPDGPHMEFSKVTLDEVVASGNVWIWETLPTDPALRTRDLFISLNPATGELWGSDVLNFYREGNSPHSFVTFWSDGADTTLVPTRSSNAVDFLEPLNGIFTYVAGSNTYIIHSDANETHVPLPPAFFLLGSGLLGLVGLRRRVRA